MIEKLLGKLLNQEKNQSSNEGKIMNNLNLKQIIKYSSADLIAGKVDKIIKEIVIDSRKVKADYLFIAIIGENKDGHRFIKEAVKNGAAAVIVDRKVEDKSILESDISILRVTDTTKALQSIASNYRISFDNLKLIAVTGSAGKTTTKDLVFSVLSEKYKCLKTKGNYNNHIGLPLTLLRLTGKEDFAIIEMGMSARGEIKLLAQIAQPDIGVITNVAKAHLKQLGTLKNIAQAKKELIDHLGKNKLAILNYDNTYTSQMIPNTKAEVISFGFDQRADINILENEFDSNQEILFFKVQYKNKIYNFKYDKAGKHNLYNSLIAILIGFEFNLNQPEIQQGLLKGIYSDLRMKFISLKNGAKLINDSYNANPLAVRAAVDVLVKYNAERKIVILSSMLELGSDSKEIHKKVGEYIARKKIDFLFTIGSEAKAIALGAEAIMPDANIISFEDKNKCISYLKKNIKKKDLILIKGSRANKLETIAKELKTEFGEL